MKRFENMSISKKLNILVVALFVVMTAIILTTSILRINSLKDNELKLAEHDLTEKYEQILENQIAGSISILDHYYKIGMESQDMESAKQQAFKALESYRYLDDGYMWIQDAEPNMIMHPFKPELNGTYIGDIADPDGKKLFSEMASVCTKSGEGYVPYMWEKPGETEPQPKLSYVKLFKEWNWIVGTGVYIDTIQKELDERDQKLSSSFATLRNFLFLALIAFAVLFIVINRYFLQKVVSKGLNEFSDIISKLASGSGDLTIRSNIHREDEIGVLSGFIDQFLDSLHKMIVDITGVTENLASMTTELSASTEEISATTNEISNGVGETSNAMESTSATVTQMAANLNTQDENIKQLSLAFKEINESTHSGSEAVNQSVERMKEIQESSEQIKNIVTVITEIANQTNLLSLNAAIEAAKAGEQGKGFAVVAEEVRKLAERSGTAAKEIAELISTSSHQVEEGSKIIMNAGDHLQKILDNVITTSNRVTEIQNSSEEQTNAVDDVVKASDAVTEHAIHNSTAIEEMSTSLVEINHTVSELSEMGDTLKSLVDRFKI